MILNFNPGKNIHLGRCKTEVEALLLTYSHNSFNDVLNIFFNQLKKYLPQLQGYLLSNAENNKKPSNFKMILYDDNLPYYKHMLDALSIIPQEYIIYFLYYLYLSLQIAI